MNHERLIIVGSGPAALTAAIYASRARLNPLILEGETPGGQLMSTTLVENWPGERSILGPQLMMNMRAQAHQLGTRFLLEKLTKVELLQKPFALTSSKNKRFTTDALIIATGATPKKLNCPGEQKYWAKGVSTCAVCDGALYKGKKIVIIGGGDTAMEEASFMTHFTDQVTIIHILDAFTASAAMQQRVLDDRKITILYATVVKEFVGNNEHLTNIVIQDTKTGICRTIEAHAAFLAIGLKPNTEIFDGQLKLTSSGHLQQINYTQTSIEGVFAAGDVADNRYRQAITSAGVGCMAALDAERYLANCKK